MHFSAYGSQSSPGKTYKPQIVKHITECDRQTRSEFAKLICMKMEEQVVFSDPANIPHKTVNKCRIWGVAHRTNMENMKATILR